MADDNDGSIERLKRRLYSRSEENPGVAKRKRLRPLGHDVEEEWVETLPQEEAKKKKSKHSILSTLLMFSVVFFIGSAGLAAYFFLGGSTTVSSQNIDIEIKGPTSVRGNEELILQVGITNRNAISIQSADLLVEYPDGTRLTDNLEVELPRQRESLGTILPGEKIQKTIRAVLFGEEGSDMEIKIILEYRVEGSNAIFFKEQLYELVLGTAPLEITVDSVEEVTSGQEVTFKVEVTSNSENILEGVLLKAEYPFGFEFKESTPQPIFTNTVWNLGDIEPEGKKTIIIRGTVVGENEEERIFRFSSGIRSTVDETQLETAFITKLQPLVIAKPFLGVTLALNGDTNASYVTGTGERIRVDIRWFNNLPTQVIDGEITVKLTGSIIDERSISVQRGFYSSSNDTVSWDRNTNGELATLSGGESGTVSFSFSTFNLSSGQTFRNPEITLDLSLRGKRVGEGAVPESVESTVVRTIKITSDLLFSSRAVYFTGPFTNTGPLPPRVETETTYALIWTVTNSHNAVGNVQVTADLPSYMRWVGVINPGSEDISFNPVGGQITWNIDTIPAGGKKEVSFQLALFPSVSQIGDAPILVDNQEVAGMDLFTRTSVGSTHPAVNTRLTTDPSFTEGKDKVTP